MKTKQAQKLWYWAWVANMTIAKQDKQKLNAPTEVWENLYVVTAHSALEAYEKAVKRGESEAGDCEGTLKLWGKPAVTVCLGVVDMGVVGPDLGDGSEILWVLKHIPQSTARKLPASKTKLLQAVSRDSPVSFIT